MGVPGGLLWVGWEVSDPMGQNVVVGWGWPTLRCEELQVLKLNAQNTIALVWERGRAELGAARQFLPHALSCSPGLCSCVCSPSPQLSSVLAPTARSCAGQQQPALLKHEI